MKYKRIGITSISISSHPKSLLLTRNDRSKYSNLSDLSFLSYQQVQHLLDVHPVAVIEVEENGYYSLAPSPIFTRLSTHPAAHKLTATLAVYKDAELDDLLPSFLLIEPALSLSCHSFLAHNLHRRHKAHKNEKLRVGTKRQLALLADCSPSAIR